MKLLRLQSALALTMVGALAFGCSGDDGDDDTINPIRDGGPTTQIDAGPRDGGSTNSCGNNICEDGTNGTQDLGESFINCAQDCDRPDPCPDGTEGCECNSNFTPGDTAFMQEDCIDADNLCIPWDTISERGAENMLPSQSCVKTCVNDADCGMNDDGSARRCVNMDYQGASIPIGSICVDRVAELDAYCGGSRNTTLHVTNDGATVHTGDEMVGCGPQATCWFGLGSTFALNPDEGICLQLCGGAGLPACEAAFPYCNPGFAEVMTSTGAVEVGICSSAQRGVGSWCGSEDDDKAGLSELCDFSDDTVGDVRCVGLGLPLGMCMELCNADANPAVNCQNTDATQGPLYCVDDLLNDGDTGICFHPNCDDSPDTCEGAGSDGNGRFCLSLTAEGDGLCGDRLDPVHATPGTLDTMLGITNGDDCNADDMGFARCPEPTRCVTTAQSGEGSCFVGCATADGPSYCETELTDLGVGTTNATCAAVFMDTSVGLCAGDP